MATSRKVIQKLKPAIAMLYDTAKRTVAGQRKAGQLHVKKRGTSIRKETGNLFKVYAPAAEELNIALKKICHHGGKASAIAPIPLQDAFRHMDWIIQSNGIPELKEKAPTRHIFFAIQVMPPPNASATAITLTRKRMASSRAHDGPLAKLANGLEGAVRGKLATRYTIK